LIKGSVPAAPIFNFPDNTRQAEHNSAEEENLLIRKG
jgi:hypothetical protein